MKKYDVIAFDLDGTLSDPAHGLIQGFVYCFKKLGIHYENENDLRKYIGPSLYEEWQEDFGFTPDEANDAIEVFREYYNIYGWWDNTLYDGIHEMLSSLKKAGKKIVLATSKPLVYYNALDKIAKLYEIRGKSEAADDCRQRAEKMKQAINEHLFDKEKGLYVGGLNTVDLVPVNEWLPENTKTVYYLKQANALAVLFGIAPKEKTRDILAWICSDLTKFEMQPYFYHFLLNALYNEGMFEEYGMPLIRRYESLLAKCDKGLSEAWENMNCDYSHAWGATPAYTLKRALSGLEILEPSYKKIKLNPQLFDLDFAEFEITTPFGKIEISMKKGEEVSIKVPKEVEII